MSLKTELAAIREQPGYFLVLRPGLRAQPFSGSVKARTLKKRRSRHGAVRHGVLPQLVCFRWLLALSCQRKRMQPLSLAEPLLSGRPKVTQPARCLTSFN